MSNVLFSISDEREKLPTLRNFLKSNGKRKLPSVFPVTIVWLPSKYPNFVFETERFRAIVYKGNPLYESLSESIEGIILGGPGLGISPDIAKPGKFDIVSLDNENPTVEPIGEYGWRITY